MEDFWRALLRGLGDDSGGSAVVTWALFLFIIALLLAVYLIEVF